jgi:hypothetical protein
MIILVITANQITQLPSLQALAAHDQQIDCIKIPQQKPYAASLLSICVCKGQQSAHVATASINVALAPCHPLGNLPALALVPLGSTNDSDVGTACSSRNQSAASTPQAILLPLLGSCHETCARCTCCAAPPWVAVPAGSPITSAAACSLLRSCQRSCCRLAPLLLLAETTCAGHYCCSLNEWVLGHRA